MTSANTPDPGAINAHINAHDNSGQIAVGNQIQQHMDTADEQSLMAVSADLQILLQQLSTQHPGQGVTNHMAVATEAVAQIQQHPPLLQRLFSALKAGGTATLKQLVKHPAATFVISALEDLQKTAPS
ncbi:hypothetical protein XM38_044600 [Halomicronema hongdechloris C2206]|uniref:Uncharacterized protein n=1 Tax=Halomicronema hongdechloris C2206 TaxID=1641165 RepID=A0A1Z3HT59_9CYAN|nr:hypothetical protein [Halomicronema hongdechloris]ASC73493.1 hypothetical protein XM38_044600 [Halomicronema hongdechloris C2206]